MENQCHNENNTIKISFIDSDSFYNYMQAGLFSNKNFSLNKTETNNASYKANQGIADFCYVI